MSTIFAVSRESHANFLDSKGSKSVTHSYAPIERDQRDVLSGTSVITKQIRRLSLNPNAEEFVPTALRSVSASSEKTLGTKSGKDAHDKKSLNRTGSTVLNGSDDEHRRYWYSQLPDDLLTDNHITSDDILEDNTGYGQSYSALMVSYENDCNLMGLESTYDVRQDGGAGQVVQQSFSIQNKPLPRNKGFSPAQIASGSCLPFSNATRYGSGSQHSLGAEQPLISQEDAQFVFGVTAEKDYHDHLEQDYYDLGDMKSLRLLAVEFPNFAMEILAEIFVANHGDLTRTIEMLTQLEFREEGCSPAPSLSAVEFPALPGFELANGLSRSGSAVSGADFAAIVQKHAGQNTATWWPYERNGCSDISTELLRYVQNLKAGVAVGNVGSKQSHISYNLEQSWWQPGLQTGDSVAPTETSDAHSILMVYLSETMYSDLREEAHDHVRVRNAYFEQARQAYLVGNKALAKDISDKLQWHNEQMKVAHTKAGEAIFRQRNTSAAFAQRGQLRLLDLHGLHVNEAILLLKRELAALKIVARTASKRQQVFIRVGTDHHIKGFRTPARLSAAVERYLIEDEHLQFTEDQPGMLRVVL